MGVPCCKSSAPQGWPWGQRSQHCSSRDQWLAIPQGPAANPHTSRRQYFQLLHRWFPKRLLPLPKAPGGPAPLLPPSRLEKMSLHCTTLASSILTRGNSHPRVPNFASAEGHGLRELKDSISVPAISGGNSSALHPTGGDSPDHRATHTSAVLEEMLMASSTQLPKVKSSSLRKKGPIPTAKVPD